MRGKAVTTAGDVQGSRTMRPSAALEVLYERHADALLTFLTRRTADPQIAADLWAETFAQVVAGERRRGVLTGDDSQDAALLYTVARRQLAGYHRRGYAEQRARVRLGLERPELGPDAAAHLEALADLDELRDRVRQALDGLPAAQREAVRLRVVEGRAYQELATRLGIAEPTARARVSRGLRALADVLSPAQASAPAAPVQEPS